MKVVTAGHIVVLSPHLDDGILSLGACLHTAASTGAHVSLVTVFAGDPEDPRPAGPWDRRAGFGTAGEAARVRREEDRRACRILSLVPVWLPFPDEQYRPGPDDDTIWTVLEPIVRAADIVYTPGFPLVHPDHRRLAALINAHCPDDVFLASYVEQPYPVFRGRLPRRRPRAPADDGAEWVSVASSEPARRAKRDACAAYRSQIPLLGRGSVIDRMLHYEARRGGETIRWRLKTKQTS